jgi:integrase/recombinase XerD
MMEELLYEFIEQGKRRKLKGSTLDDHMRTVNTFFTFLRENYPDIRDITEIQKDVVLSYEKYLASKRDGRGKIISTERRKRHLSHLKSFFLYLQKEERIYSNPAANISFPRERKRILKDVLTVDEMENLLTACSGHSMGSLRDRSILEVLYSTGVRADELCNICTADIDLDEEVLFVRRGKLGNQRVVPFGRSAGYWVKRYLEKARPLICEEDNELLFVSLKGKKLNPDILCRIIKKWAGIAGIGKNVTTHTFRHSCASHMLKGRADIRYVQRQLGHRSISTTEKYLKIEITDLKEVHERTHPREREDW